MTADSRIVEVENPQSLQVAERSFGQTWMVPTSFGIAASVGIGIATWAPTGTIGSTLHSDPVSPPPRDYRSMDGNDTAARRDPS